jgi:hypothetical protein
MSSPKINKKLLVHAEIFENLTLSLGGWGGDRGVGPLSPASKLLLQTHNIRHTLCTHSSIVEIFKY